jgi:hypothetical protein
MATTSESMTEKELILCAVFKILEGDAQILLNTRPITAAAQNRAESLINAQDVILGMLRDPVE